jgi:hypothetical protein
LQLRAISSQWQMQVREKRVTKWNAFAKAFNKWLRQITAKEQELKALLSKKAANASSVTTADWNLLVQGSEHKLCVILRLPRSRWMGGTHPLTGAYLEVFMHCRQIKNHHARREVVNSVNKAMAMLKNLARKARENETSVTLAEWEAAIKIVTSLKVPSPLTITATLRAFMERARARKGAHSAQKAREGEDASAADP